MIFFLNLLPGIHKLRESVLHGEVAAPRMTFNHAHRVLSRHVTPESDPHPMSERNHIVLVR